MQKGSPREAGQIQVLILAGIVILIVLAGGIFFLGRVTVPKPQSQPQNVTTSSPQPSLTPDETVYTEADRSANWKTYINTKYGFSFKYPTSMSLDEERESSSNPQLFIRINRPNPYFEFSLSISTESKETIEKDFGYLKDRSSIKVDGIETTEYAGYGGVAGTVHHQRVLLSKDNLTYQFSAGTYDEKDIFNQILSSFRFLP